MRPGTRGGLARAAAAVATGLAAAVALALVATGGDAQADGLRRPVEPAWDGGVVLAQAPPVDAGSVTATCVEVLPKGATRPQMTATFPEAGPSGYEARLVVTIEHGGGETVLPEGFRWERSSDAARAIENAGFVIPEQDGGSPPIIERQDKGEGAVTTLSIPVVPLPADPGRHLLRLPSLPIKVARASGEVMSLCTPPMAITVEDPIANEDDPQVKPNPPPRPQREDWHLAKQLFFGALAGVAAAVALFLLLRWLRRRPKVVPAPPKVLPWVAALQELEAIRQSGLIDAGRSDEFFDRVSDCIRKYLGERYGFDGLESTTAETRRLLKRVYPPLLELDSVVRFLEDSDLVKFARLVPTAEDCQDAMKRAEHIVRSTTPSSATPPAGRPPVAKPRRAA